MTPKSNPVRFFRCTFKHGARTIDNTDLSAPPSVGDHHGVPGGEYVVTGKRIDRTNPRAKANTSGEAVELVIAVEPAP